MGLLLRYRKISNNLITDIIMISSSGVITKNYESHGFIAMILVLYATDIIGIIAMILMLYDTDIEGFIAINTHIV